MRKSSQLTYCGLQFEDNYMIDSSNDSNHMHLGESISQIEIMQLV